MVKNHRPLTLDPAEKFHNLGVRLAGTEKPEQYLAVILVFRHRNPSEYLPIPAEDRLTGLRNDKGFHPTIHERFGGGVVGLVPRCQRLSCWRISSQVKHASLEPQPYSDRFGIALHIGSEFNHRGALKVRTSPLIQVPECALVNRISSVFRLAGRDRKS